MGNKGDLGSNARSYLRSASYLKLFPGGSAEKFHQSLVYHEKAGGYMGGDKSWQRYNRVDSIRHDVEIQNKIKTPQFDEDLRNMDLNEQSFNLLQKRMRSFPEERGKLYDRMKQLEDTAVARGDKDAQKRLESIGNVLKSEIGSDSRKPETRLDFDRVESALQGMQGGELKNLEGLTQGEWDFAKARLEGYGKSPEAVLKELHDTDPQRYRDTLNALNKTEAGNLRSDVQSELQRIASDPSDPQFDHPELKEAITSNQVVPHASRLAQTWGLEGGNDQVQTQALQAQANYGDEAIRNLKSRTEAWNALPQNLRSELMFDQSDVSQLTSEQRSQLADLSLQSNFEAMANNELTGQAKSLLTGDPPLEKQLGTMREEKLSELQHEMTVARRMGYINEDSRGLLLGFDRQIKAAEDQKSRLRYDNRLKPSETQRFIDDFTERAEKDPQIKELRDKLQNGDRLDSDDRKLLTKELDDRISDYKKTDSFADVVHNDPHWLRDLFEWGSEAKYAEQQAGMIRQFDLNDRHAARQQRDIEKIAGQLDHLDRAQLSGAYEKAKAYGDIETADKMALESWKQHGANLKNEQPDMARDMERKGDSALTESTWDRLAREGKVDGNQAWDKPDAANFRSAMQDFENASGGKDGIEGSRQRALQQMLKSDDFKDITALSGDLAKTYGTLQEYIDGGLTGSPMPAYIDKIRKDADLFL